MRRYVSLVIWWLFVAQSVVGAEPETAAALRGIEAELIADVKAIRPGKAFTVGLKVTHDDTFHTYWQNPGIVGVPFIFEWTLPPGFSAGPIQWPAPEHVMMFDYPAYGYTRDLLLMVTIQPPADAVPKKVSIGLQASWMACGSSCHPGNHRFALALPGEASTSPKASPTASVFEAARKELPVPLQGWSVRVESAVDAAEIRIRLRALESGGRSEVAPETCTFFSSDGQVSSRPPQRWSRASDGSLVMVVFRSEYGPKGRSSLPGVLYCSGGWGPQGTPQYMRVQPPVAATK